MTPASFFDDIPEAELRELLERLPRRRYPRGAVVVAEGETRHEICVMQSGSADVLVSDRHGVEHVVGRVGPGTTIGEMSAFTGMPAAASVRAAEELEVVVIDDFESLCAAFPQVYRNVGAILSDRLARTDRLVAREDVGRLLVLEDRGAPQLLGYALACSIAWHTRASTLFVLVTDAPDEDVRRLARSAREPPNEARAVVTVAVPTTPDSLAATIAELRAGWEHVIVSGGVVLAEDAQHARVPESVPPLDAADHSALTAGLLSLETPAGAALGSTARILAGLRVGVALGAGSIRGYAHWGVMDALAEMGIPVDMIAGSSVGGSVAAIWACGHSGSEGVDVFTRSASTLFRPTLPMRSMLSNRALSRSLDDLFGDARIEDVEPPLAITTTDLRARRLVVLRRGSVARAVLATLAIPGIYPPLRSGSDILVDGGVLEPVPITVAAEMGADVVVGVRLLARSAPDEPRGELREESTARQPSALGTIMRSIEIMQTRVSPEPVEATTIVITPELENIPSMKLRNFSAGRRYVEPGRAEALAAHPRLAAALPWIRR